MTKYVIFLASLLVGCSPSPKDIQVLEQLCAVPLEVSITGKMIEVKCKELRKLKGN